MWRHLSHYLRRYSHLDSKSNQLCLFIPKNRDNFTQKYKITHHDLIDIIGDQRVMWDSDFLRTIQNDTYAFGQLNEKHHHPMPRKDIIGLVLKCRPISSNYFII